MTVGHPKPQHIDADVSPLTSTPFLSFFRHNSNWSIDISVDDSAKDVFHSNTQNTIFDTKRLISRKFDEYEVQSRSHL